MSKSLPTELQKIRDEMNKELNNESFSDALRRLAFKPTEPWIEDLYERMGFVQETKKPKLRIIK